MAGATATQTPDRHDLDPQQHRPFAARRRRVARAAVIALLWVGIAVLIRDAVLHGRELQRTAPEVFLGAAPLVGRSFRDGWDWRFGWGLVGAAVVGAGVVWSVVSGWIERARLRWVVTASGLGAAVFAVLLALTDGRDGILFGAADENEYLANLPNTPPAGAFVRDFVHAVANDAPRYSVHVRGHPPGFVVLLKAFDSIGLSGPWPVAMLSIVSTLALPIGVLVAVWATAGDGWARRAAPFLVVAPYALWMVTSADAFYAALAAWGVAALAVALRSDTFGAAAFGAVAGFVLSMLLFFTYGAAIFMLLPAVVVVGCWRRARAPGRVVASAVVVALAVTGGWRMAGFWWFDGAAATRAEYWEGTAQFREWKYFLLANIAVTLVAIGPATVVGLTRLRDRSLWLLVGGALAALLVADASQYSKGEVERIWLLFFPWLVVAGAALYRVGPDGFSVRARRWPAAGVAAQAVTAVVLQAALVSKW